LALKLLKGQPRHRREVISSLLDGRRDLDQEGKHVILLQQLQRVCAKTPSVLLVLASQSTFVRAIGADFAVKFVANCSKSAILRLHELHKPEDATMTERVPRKKSLLGLEIRKES
jgi:hypothetical protein